MLFALNKAKIYWQFSDFCCSTLTEVPKPMAIIISKMGGNQCTQWCEDTIRDNKHYEETHYQSSRARSQYKGDSSFLLIEKKSATPKELFLQTQALFHSSQVFSCLLDETMLIGLLNKLIETCITPQQASHVCQVVCNYIEKSFEHAQHEHQPPLDAYQQFMTKIGKKLLKVDQELTIFHKRINRIREYVIQQNTGSVIDTGHYLRELKFEFSETDKVIETVKQLGQIDERTFALITNFLLKCCSNLEKQGKSVSQVESSYQELLSIIIKKYVQPELIASKSLLKSKTLPTPKTRASAQTSHGYEVLEGLSPAKREEKLQKVLEGTMKRAEEGFIKIKVLLSDPCHRHGSRFKVNSQTRYQTKQHFQYAIKQEIVKNCGIQVKPIEVDRSEVKDLQTFFKTQMFQWKKMIDGALSSVACLPQIIEMEVISVNCMFPSAHNLAQCVKEIQAIVSLDTSVQIALPQGQSVDGKEPSTFSLKISTKGVTASIYFAIQQQYYDQQLGSFLCSLRGSTAHSPLTTLSQTNQRLSPSFFGLIHDIIQKHSESSRVKYMDLQTLEQIKQLFEDQKPSSSWLENPFYMVYFQQVKDVFLKARSIRVQAHPVREALLFYNSFHLLIAQQKQSKIIQHLKQITRQHKPPSEGSQPEDAAQQEIQVLTQLYPDLSTSISLIYGIGDCYSSKGDFQNCLKFYLKALDLMKQKNGKDIFQSVPKINKIASIYYAHGMNAEALQFFLRGLQINVEYKGRQSIECATSLNSIGMVYDSQGQTEEALKCYEKCLQIKEILKGKDSIECASTLNNIGMVYKGLGSYRQALKYYQRCLGIIQKVKGKDSIDCTMPLNNIAMAYDSMGNHTQALKCQERSLRIQQRVKGKDAIECALTLNNIASVYYSQQRYNEALRFYQRCFEIQERVKGINSIDCASTLNNIASVYDGLGNFEAALKCYQKCLSIEESVKGKDSMQCASTLNNIGMAYDGHGRHEEALQVYERCLKIKQKTKGKDNIECASTLNNIASVYFAQKKAQQALAFYQRSLAILLKSNDQQSVLFLSTLRNIASVHYSQSNYPQALKIWKRALAIKERVNGPESIQYSVTLSNLGMTYLAMGNYGEALSHYERCLRIQQKVKGKDSYECALTLNCLGTIYKGKENSSDSLKFLQRCLALKEHGMENNMKKYSELVRSTGMVFDGDGNYKEALASFQKCLQITRQVKGKESKECAPILQNIAVVLLQLGKLQAATRYFAEAKRIAQFYCK